MKAQAVTFYSSPRKVTLFRETQTVSSIEAGGWTREQVVPLKQGGGRLTATYDGRYSIDIGSVFMEFGVLWRITSFVVGDDCVKVEARSIASIQDLVELIPVL